MWKYPPQKILVAVDFGEAASRALEVAGVLARGFDAAVQAIHAERVEAPPYVAAGQLRAIERQLRAARTEAKAYLERFARRLAGVPIAPAISTSPPAEAVLHASRHHDLIVMGTHGRRGPARWWAGSVAERVVRESSIPVLVVRARPAPGSAVFSRLVVIALGGTFDGPARRYARGLAATFGGEATRESVHSLQPAALERATLLVVAQPDRGATLTPATRGVEQAIRVCRRPMLFVPAT